MQFIEDMKSSPKDEAILRRNIQLLQAEIAYASELKKLEYKHVDEHSTATQLLKSVHNTIPQLKTLLQYEYVDVCEASKEN